MGHSFTHFRGVGFTAKDWKVAVWLHLLAREVDQMPQPPEWLSAARDHWREQAMLSINGCISPDLDKFLTDGNRIAVIRKMVQRIYSSLLESGERLSPDFLNTLCHLPLTNRYRTDPRWTQDVETELFLAYGRAFLKLLDGKMTHYELV